MESRIQEFKEFMETQQKLGNLDEKYDSDYCIGLYNGLETALAILEDRKPVLRLTKEWVQWNTLSGVQMREIKL